MSILNPPPPTKHNFLSFGAGVQSTTLAFMAMHKEITPDLDFLVFADTHGEPQEVYDWLEEIKKLLPYEIVVVTNGSLEEAELEIKERKKDGKKYRKSLIPAFAKNKDGSVGLVGRKCTEDFKINPVQRYLKKRFQIKRGQKELVATQWMGISWDEVQRVKESRNPWLQNRWPLIEKQLTRRHCKEWMKANGYPEPPRSACYYCPFHSDDEWRRLKTDHPAEFKKAIKFEKKIQATNELAELGKSDFYLHPSCKPLEEVDLRTDTEKGQTLLDITLNDMRNECAGLCGV